MGKNNRGGGNRGGGGDGNNYKGRGDRYKFHCQTCGPNNSHATKDCRKKSNTLNNDTNKVHKKTNNNKNTSKQPCIKCGTFGHNFSKCTAKELPVEQRCPCGNRFHYPSKCPWDRDEDKFEKAKNLPGNMVCAWCKPGDGYHDISTCERVKEFSRGLGAIITAEFHRLNWCWYCLDDGHRTMQCQCSEADISAIVWNNQIREIVYSIKQAPDEPDRRPSFAQFADDPDVPDPGLQAEFLDRAPSYKEFGFCILCECLYLRKAEEHGIKNCNSEKYDMRNTARQNQKNGFAGIGNTAPTVGRFGPIGVRPTVPVLPAGHFYSPCSVPGCTNKLTFPKEANPGYTKYCSMCQTSIPHPGAPRKSSLQRNLELLIELQAAQIKQNIEPEYTEFYTKHARPSNAIPAYTAQGGWPSLPPEQTFTPRYGAQRIMTKKGDRPLMLRDEEVADFFPNRPAIPVMNPTKEFVFDHPGNWQTYFPGYMIRLTANDLRIQDDDRFPINRAAKWGEERRCRHCDAVGVVLDDEDDVVMVGADAANTAGCGAGFSYWRGTSYRNQCWCNPLYGPGTEEIWVR